MAYRYTEKELADIQARQAVNLSNFQRNSGRGLPKDTVREMERAQGVKLDLHGAALPVPLPQMRGKKVTRAKKAPKTRLPKADIERLPELESRIVQALEKGEKVLSTSSGRAVNIPRIGKAKAPQTVGLRMPTPDLPPAKRRAALKSVLDHVDRGFAYSHVNPSAPSIARYRKRAECDGIQFDSQLEMRRYKELKLLKAGGAIKYFLRQVPFHLPGGITARIDFMVVHWIQTGSADVNTAWCFVEYEDCKAGMGKRSAGRYNDADRVGVNKRKQIKALYGVEVKLVTKARG